MRKQPDPPTPSEIQTVLGNLEQQRGGASKTEVICKCPSCHKPKMHFNQGSGMFHCKRAECGAMGNLWQLANLLGIRVRQGGDSALRPVSVASGSFTAAVDAPPPSPIKIKQAKGMEPPAVADRVAEMLEGGEVLDYARSRGFTDMTIRRFQLHAWESKRGDKCLVIPYLTEDKVQLAKLRILPEYVSGPKYVRKPAGADSIMFNRDAIEGSKQVVLVEGELDAISLWQMGITNVVSTSLGAQKRLPAGWVKELECAEDIVIWYDPDEAGQQSAAAVVSQLGLHRCRIVDMEGSTAQEAMCGQLKDPNDILAADVDAATKAAWVAEIVASARHTEDANSASAGSLAEILRGMLDRAHDGVEAGATCGMPGLDTMMEGFTPGHVVLMIGQSGHGKTSMARSIMLGLAEQGYPVFLTSFEGGLVGLAKYLFHRYAGMSWDEATGTAEARAQHGEHVDWVLKTMDRNPLYYSTQTEGDLELEAMLASIEYHAMTRGCRHVLVDILDSFTVGRDGSATASIKDEVMSRLAALAERLGLWVLVTSQCKPNPDGISTTPSGGPRVANKASLGVTVHASNNALEDNVRRRGKVMMNGDEIEITLAGGQTMLVQWKVRDMDRSGFKNKTFDYDFAHQRVVDLRPLPVDNRDEPSADSHDPADPFPDLFN